MEKTITYKVPVCDDAHPEPGVPTLQQFRDASKNMPTSLNVITYKDAAVFEEAAFEIREDYAATIAGVKHMQELKEKRDVGTDLAKND